MSKKKKKKPVDSGETQGERDQKGRWIPGVSGNPDGPLPGYTHFKTDFERAAIEIGEALRLGKDPDKIKVELMKRGIREGLAGKYPFWDKLMERLYGSVKQSYDISGKIEATVEQGIEIDPETKKALELWRKDNDNKTKTTKSRDRFLDRKRKDTKRKRR